MLLALGIGNLAFGNYKHNQYVQILTSTLDSQTTENFNSAYTSSSSPPFLDTEVNFSQQYHYIARLRSRLHFYQLVIIGGKCFLALSGLFLLCSLVTLRNVRSTAAALA